MIKLSVKQDKPASNQAYLVDGIDMEHGYTDSTTTRGKA
jgi:hypothetical protein